LLEAGEAWARIKLGIMHPEIKIKQLNARHRSPTHKYLPTDQLALGPQCGFGGIDSTVLSEDEMWLKLDIIVKTAATVWKYH